MRGMPCPACASPLLSFGRFLCEVDVDTVLRCDACGAALGRGRAEIALLGALALVFGAVSYVAVRLTLADPTGGALAALALYFVIAPPAFLLLARFIGWKLIAWKQLAPPPRHPVAQTRPT